MYPLWQVRAKIMFLQNTQERRKITFNRNKIHNKEGQGKSLNLQVILNLSDEEFKSSSHFKFVRQRRRKQSELANINFLDILLTF